MSYTPPQTVQSAARRGLRLLEKTKAGTPVGWARARDLSAGRAVSLETVGRMVSFFARHGAQRPANVGSDSDPSPWLVAWLLWGGDAGEAWAKSVWRREGNVEASESWSEPQGASVVAWRDGRGGFAGQVPEGLQLGKPFRLASVGGVFSRYTGAPLGELSEGDLLEMAEGVCSRALSTDAVVIDWAHASAPDDPASQDPRRGAVLGRVVYAWVEDEDDGRGAGLYVLPAWTELGASVVPQQVGALWSSPEWRRGDAHDRATGERVAGVQLLAVGLTPRPAQRHDRVDLVTWSEKGGRLMDGELSQEAFDALRAERDALAARVAEMEAAKAAGEAEAEASMEGEAMAEPAKMRELGAEVSKLREEHAKLLADLSAERRERELDRIVAEGRQPEASRKVGRQLWAVREVAPDAWRAWAEAPASAPERKSAAGAGAPVDAVGGMLAEAERRASAQVADKGSKAWSEAKSGALRVLMREATTKGGV